MVAQPFSTGLRERRAQIRGATIYSEVVGSGEPLVLLHGLGGSTRWWGRNIAALARWNELHIIDMIGFGRSPGRFVLAEAAEVLAEWMERWGLGRASLLGHSMGGYIAADLAACHPQLVDRLVLVGAAMSVGGVRAEPGSTPRRAPIPLSMLSVALPDALRAGIPTLARAAYEMATSDMGPRLERISAPTLLVWGEEDPAVPLSVGRALAARLSDATLAVIEDAGHAPMWEQPFAFNRVVSEFLAGVPLSGAPADEARADLSEAVPLT